MASREAIGSWPAWQRTYAAGVLLIWPPDDVRAAVGALRSRYDPVSEATCGAHVSVTQPLLREPDAAGWRAIAVAIASVPAFRCAYGPAGSFLPAPVIWLAIAPAASVLALREAVHATGWCDLSLPHTEGFVPHMTITEGRSGGEVDEALLAEIAAAAPAGTFEVSHLAHAVPDDDFRFAVRATWPLGGAA